MPTFADHATLLMDSFPYPHKRFQTLPYHLFSSFSKEQSSKIIVMVDNILHSLPNQSPVLYELPDELKKNVSSNTI